MRAIKIPKNAPATADYLAAEHDQPELGTGIECSAEKQQEKPHAL